MDLSRKCVLLLFIAICLVALIGDAESRGRGGGRFGGRYSSSRSRYSRTRYRSTRIRTGRSWSWKAAAAGGYIYGYSHYRTRRRYYSSPDSEPSICRNNYDYKMTNGTYYTMFICPRYEDPDDHTYCCGPSDRQKCCGFWDDGGRVFGVVAGILIFLGIIGCCVYCCCFKGKKKKPQSPPGGVVFQTTTTTTTKYEPTATDPSVAGVPPQGAGDMYPPANNGYPPPSGPTPYPTGPGEKSGPPADGYPTYPQPYPSQPYPGAPGDQQPPMAPYPTNDGNAGYPPAAAPPPYDAAGNANYQPPPPGNAPYPTGPGGAAPYPPTGAAPFNLPQN